MALGSGDPEISFLAVVRCQRVRGTLQHVQGAARPLVLRIRMMLARFLEFVWPTGYYGRPPPETFRGILSGRGPATKLGRQKREQIPTDIRVTRKHQYIR